MAAHAHPQSGGPSQQLDGHAWAARVEHLCADRNLQVTALRRQIIDMMAAAAAALTAYEMIDKLGRLQGRAVGPPTVYRTLDFLIENGFVVKIESRNAYARCDCPGHHHHGALLICAQCGRTDEIDDVALDTVLGAIAETSGFAIRRQVVELEGLCAACQRAAA